MPWSNSLLKLLSAQRQKGRPEFPAPLSLAQIVAAVRTGQAPRHHNESDRSTKGIEQTLKLLCARGDLLNDGRERYCMAPPVVLCDESGIYPPVFRGDRAYFARALEALESPVSEVDAARLRPKKASIPWMESRLEAEGVRVLRYSEFVDRLPAPHPPYPHHLRAPAADSPFASGQVVERYESSPGKYQDDRWVPVRQADVNEGDILRVASQAYFVHQRQYFELEDDVALMAMFYQDQSRGAPTPIAWDAAEGRLHLKHVSLPWAYFGWIWDLAHSEGNRTHHVQDPANRPLVVAALTHLGCTLI